MNNHFDDGLSSIDDDYMPSENDDDSMMSSSSNIDSLSSSNHTIDLTAMDESPIGEIDSDGIIDLTNEDDDDNSLDEDDKNED